MLNMYKTSYLLIRQIIRHLLNLNRIKTCAYKFGDVCNIYYNFKNSLWSGHDINKSN